MSHLNVEREFEQRERAASLREAALRAKEHTDADVDPTDDDAAKGFGHKTITFWGSFCLNLNNCMGPAMVLLPLLNQQAGWLTPSIAMVVVYALSSFAATMLCEAMQRIPGNFTFEHRYEFATTVRHYYGRTAYIVFQVFYNLSMQASNIAAMIISAKVLDKFIGKIGHHSYALDYIHWKFVKSTGDADNPWCNGELIDGTCEELTWILSIGFLVCMAICIPFGYLNLDENMWFQWLSLAGLLFFTFEFYISFLLNMPKDDKLCLDGVEYNVTCDYEPGNPAGNFSHNGMQRTPLFGDSAEGQANVVGMAVFAYSYVVTIPSWVNEKRHHVSVNKAVWVPATVGLIMKLLAGILGGWAFALMLPNGKPRPHADDILNILLLRDQPWYSQYSAYLWDITTLIPGIPVLAIMVRYNLLSGKVCNRFWSFFFGVVAPWIVTMFLYESNVLTAFCNWVAIVVQGYINFVIPAMLYRSALLRYPDHCAEQFETKQPAEADESTSLLHKPAAYVADSPEQPGYTAVAPPKFAINVDDSDDDSVDGFKAAPGSPLSFTELDEAPVNAVPRFIYLGATHCKVNRIYVANFIIVFFTLLSTASIVINVIDLF
eukprot:TRINITY_DN10338_c0_g1_i6.p1 TRINITY_DN10338_c0_g1~~TRINITY_DN10338_c0_g1_i6.p1  ORF type:complete len:603 (+),score=166.30 TRINITY_DN10338_c0_g1_i6:181-1989(+)